MSALITYGTIVVQRDFDVPPSRLFELFAKVSERQKWGAPSEGSAYIVEEDDFREGGYGRVRCGSAESPRITVDLCYHRIINGQLLLFTENIKEEGALLAVNVTSGEFFTTAAGSRCRTTVQIASLVGYDMIENTKAGHEGSMSMLEKYLASIK